MTNAAPVSASVSELLDLAFAPFLTRLETELSWLTTAYGVAQRLEKVGANGTGKIVYPGIFCGGTEYLNMLPDEHLGSYVFLDLNDGYEARELAAGLHSVKGVAGFCFWFDFRTVADVHGLEPDQISLENVKAEAAAALRLVRGQGLSFKLVRFWENSANIYKGYTVDETQRQFLMRPYGGFRMDVEFIFRPNQCYA